jgi:rSAM/selenodomain-associated transferase 2
VNAQQAADPNDGPESIAVIVPVLNEAAQIAELLDTLRGHAFAQTIVADGGSDDGTRDIVRAAAADAELVCSARGRGRQLNAGAAVARTEILLFLHADTRLPGDASARVRMALRAPGVAAGAFRATFDAPHPLLSLYARATALDSVFTTFGDQAFFMRARVFRDAGGFADWPFLEDVDLRRRLKRKGRFVKLSAAVVTSARRFRAGGIAKQQLRNGLILCAFLAGISPHKLSKWYAPHRAPIDPGAKEG